MPSCQRLIQCILRMSTFPGSSNSQENLCLAIFLNVPRNLQDVLLATVSSILLPHPCKVGLRSTFSPSGFARPTPKISIEDRLRELADIPEKYIPSTASFLRACFVLDPAKRQTAQELEMHRWVFYAPYNSQYDDPHVADGKGDH